MTALRENFVFKCEFPQELLREIMLKVPQLIHTSSDGSLEGSSEGIILGSSEGKMLGSSEGKMLGSLLGASEGSKDGCTK